MHRYIVAITGASGVVYGVRMVEELLKNEFEIHLIISQAACLVLEHELGWDSAELMDGKIERYFQQDKLFYYHNSDIAARIASGSFITDGMIIIPCSMSTVASVATGMSNNLIERSADVMLKERRPLIIVPRETPLSQVHLKNLLNLAEMGVSIVPAMPGFYHKPECLDDIISFIVGKVLDQMRISHSIFNRYE